MTGLDGGISTVREAELELLRPHVRPGMTVLELGTAGGDQARVISSWGATVVGLEVDRRAAQGTMEVPVLEYDGYSIPLKDQSVDIVFSSCVLEHVERLPELLRETARVLRARGSDGPSRPYANVALLGSRQDPVFAAREVRRFATRRVRSQPAPPHRVGAVTATIPDGLVPKLRRLPRLIVPSAHGTGASPFSELWTWRRSEWARVTAAAGFSVEAAVGNGYCYTGNGTLPALSPLRRRSLAKALGSLCVAIVTRKPA